MDIKKKIVYIVPRWIISICLAWLFYAHGAFYTFPFDWSKVAQFTPDVFIYVTIGIFAGICIIEYIFEHS